MFRNISFYKSIYFKTIFTSVSLLKCWLKAFLIKWFVVCQTWLFNSVLEMVIRLGYVYDCSTLYYHTRFYIFYSFESIISFINMNTELFHLHFQVLSWMVIYIEWSVQFGRGEVLTCGLEVPNLGPRFNIYFWMSMCANRRCDFLNNWFFFFLQNRLNYVKGKRSSSWAS